MKTESIMKILCFLIAFSPPLAGQFRSTATWKPASLILLPLGIDKQKISFDHIFSLQDGNAWVSFTTGKGAEFNIAKSKDGGVSWRHISHLPQYGWIDSFYFIDANRGWASTNMKQYVEGSASAILLQTTDGGLSWQKWSSLESLKVRGLLGIHFENNGTGFAAGVVMPGQYGVVLRTEDFGKTWWIEQTIESADYFRGIAICGNINWALSHHKILLGENGRNWKTVFDKSDMSLGMSIDAPTEMSVITVLGFGKVVLSEDKGRTWKVIQLPAPYEELALGAVKFADPRHGWVVGITGGTTVGINHGIILETNDGGNNWQFDSQVDPPLSAIAVSGSNILVTGRDTIYWRNRP
jgi:photosystem II stability/assembly factor-like uncharacterized protein